MQPASLRMGMDRLRGARGLRIGAAGASSTGGRLFEHLLKPVDSIALEEPEGDPANLIVGVMAIAPTPGGRIVVVDRKSARVRIYSGTGGHRWAGAELAPFASPRAPGRRRNVMGQC